MPGTCKRVLYGLLDGGRPAFARAINAALLNVVIVVLVSESRRYGLLPGPRPFFHSFVLPFFLYRSLCRLFKMSIFLMRAVLLAPRIRTEGRDGDQGHEGHEGHEA